MAKLIYRVVSACGALGYGFPKESLDEAVKGGVDAIVSDAGSMDAGPHYLGTGTEYFERDAVKSDFRFMVQAAQRAGVPVILGSCGMAGGDRNLDWMLDVAREVFAELNVRDAKVAAISSELDPEIVISEYRKGALLPTGRGPELTEAALRESTIVGQMGIHPLITALDAGAQYIFAGRACDIALFASDMIRRGIDPGLAYHVGHVLECGALACDPGSPSDCLVAEIYDDGCALFVAPNPARRCMPYSIAAHSLHEESHPQLQFYPEGVLAMEKTEFHARDSRTTAIRNSQFTGEGAHQLTAQEISQFARLGLRPVIFVLNNSGYLIERLLCKKPAITYNDLAPWRYADLPRVLGCDGWFTARAATCGELDQAMEIAARGDTAAYIEVVTAAYEASPLSMKLHDNLRSLYPTSTGPFRGDQPMHGVHAA